MSNTEETSASSDHETRVGDVSGAMHAGSGDIIHIEKVEWMAERVRDTLQRSLPAEGKMRDELRQVVAELISLQAQMAEWKELHHILHQILVAFSPFHARLIPLGSDGLSTSECQVLLKNWRPCQSEIDMLVDFAGEIEHIGRPFDREGRELRGERWVVEIAALQSLVEDVLKEETPNLESLLELAEEFNSACHRHLALADRKLRAVVGKLQRLSTRLLGGLL